MKNRKYLILTIVILITLAFVSCGDTNKGFTQDDLVFEINGQAYHLDTDSTSLINALGDEYTYEEAVSCAFSGMDKTFSYTGIDIYTYPLDGNDNIDELYITSSDYSTRAGITVGSTLADINKAYGENYTDLGGGMLVIAPEGNSEDTSDACLYFILDGDTVMAFSYYSASNRQ